MDARDWIVRLTSGNVSDADIQRFKAWRDRSAEHGRAFERERLFWRQLQALDGTSDGMPPFLPTPAARRPAMARRAFLVGGGAAVTAAAAAIAVPRLQLWRNADFMTGVGQQTEITLPDGSVATLNTDSAIAVHFTPDLRLVELLKGEAVFRVRPDTSALFRVAALGGNSDALGTTYSVKAVDGTATITVTEGHVRVSGVAAPGDPAVTDTDRVELFAEQQTSYVSGGRPAAPSAVDSAAALAWRSGRVIFEGCPFGTAVAELGRYMPERIVLAPGVDANIPVSAIFSTGDALAGVQALAKTQGLTARRIPDLLVVIS